MGESLASLLDFGMLWVLFILVGTLVGIWLLVFYWQYKISRSLKKIPPGFIQIQSEIKSILTAIQSYSPDDPPPYGLLVAGINKQLDTIANRLAALKKQYVDIQNQHHKLRLDSWQLIISAPFYLLTWYSMDRGASTVQREIVELQDLVSIARSQVKDLDKQAWILALRSRAVLTHGQNIRKLIDHLSDQKLYGDTFELISEKEDRVIEALELIPDYFLLAEENNISDHATKADVCEVHKILSETEPVLDEMQDKLSLWTGEYERLAEKAAHARQQIAHVEQLINSAPQGIVLNSQRSQLVVLNDTLKVLTDTLSRLEVESIVPVDQELDQVQKNSADIGAQLRQGYREYTNLKQLLEKLFVIQSECSDLFGALLKSTTYPILWDRSQIQFMDLNKRINDLGDSTKPRTLEEIKAKLAAAQEIFVLLVSMSDHFNKIRGLHEELLSLFNSDEIQGGYERFGEYTRLGNQITQYNPDNWTKTDSPVTYLEDVHHLETEHKAFLERDHTKSIPESEIEIWLKKADNLVKEQKKLQIRSEKLKVRLQYIQNTENNARNLYETAQKAFNQIKWLVNSNILLKRTAEKELNKLSQQLDQLGDLLNHPQFDLVENKVRMAQSLNESVEGIGQRCLERLNQDINQRSTILAGKVEFLRGIASLEDPAIDKVQRLLAHEERKQPLAQPVPSFHMTSEETIAELKGRSLIWQELVAAQKELEEIVETPLVDAFNHAEAQRKRAMDALAKAATIIPEQRKWPPCTVSISEDQLELNRLESTRSSLISQKTRAIWAVRQYGELAASYQTLAGKIERTSEWAAHEQKRIEDLESEIKRLNQQWQRQEQVNAGDPETVERIRYIRAQANLSLERQKQNWVLSQPGSSDEVNYEGILQNLIEIARTLRTSTVGMQEVSEG